MDMPRSEVRDLRFDQFSVTKHLEHASAQARARNYQDFLIVDVDSHHYENESYKDLFQYIDNPVIRRAAIESTKRPGRSSMMNHRQSGDPPRRDRIDQASRPFLDDEFPGRLSGHRRPHHAPRLA